MIRRRLPGSHSRRPGDHLRRSPCRRAAASRRTRSPRRPQPARQPPSRSPRLRHARRCAAAPRPNPRPRCCPRRSWRLPPASAGASLRAGGTPAGGWAGWSVRKGVGLEDHERRGRGRRLRRRFRWGDEESPALEVPALVAVPGVRRACRGTAGRALASSRPRRRAAVPCPRRSPRPSSTTRRRTPSSMWSLFTYSAFQFFSVCSVTCGCGVNLQRVLVAVADSLPGQDVRAEPDVVARRVDLRELDRHDEQLTPALGTAGPSCPRTVTSRPPVEQGEAESGPSLPS